MLAIARVSFCIRRHLPLCQQAWWQQVLLPGQWPAAGRPLSQPAQRADAPADERSATAANNGPVQTYDAPSGRGRRRRGPAKAAHSPGEPARPPALSVPAPAVLRDWQPAQQSRPSYLELVRRKTQQREAQQEQSRQQPQKRPSRFATVYAPAELTHHIMRCASVGELRRLLRPEEQRHSSASPRWLSSLHVNAALTRLRSLAEQQPQRREAALQLLDDCLVPRLLEVLDRGWVGARQLAGCMTALSDLRYSLPPDLEEALLAAIGSGSHSRGALRSMMPAQVVAVAVAAIKLGLREPALWGALGLTIKRLAPTAEFTPALLPDALWACMRRRRQIAEGSVLLAHGEAWGRDGRANAQQVLHALADKFLDTLPVYVEAGALKQIADCIRSLAAAAVVSPRVARAAAQAATPLLAQLIMPAAEAASHDSGSSSNSNSSSSSSSSSTSAVGLFRFKRPAAAEEKGGGGAEQPDTLDRWLQQQLRRALPEAPAGAGGRAPGRRPPATQEHTGSSGEEPELQEASDGEQGEEGAAAAALQGLQRTKAASLPLVVLDLAEAYSTWEVHFQDNMHVSPAAWEQLIAAAGAPRSGGAPPQAAVDWLLLRMLCSAASRLSPDGQRQLAELFEAAAREVHATMSSRAPRPLEHLQAAYRGLQAANPRLLSPSAALTMTAVAKQLQELQQRGPASAAPAAAQNALEDEEGEEEEEALDTSDEDDDDLGVGHLLSDEESSVEEADTQAEQREGSPEPGPASVATAGSPG